MHEYRSHDVEHPYLHTVRCGRNSPSASGRPYGIVVRAQQTRLILDEIKSFASIPDMVPRGQYINPALVQKLLKYAGSHATAARCVFGIDHGEVCFRLILKFGQRPPQRLRLG